MGSLAGGIEIISAIIYKINSLILALAMLTGGVGSPSKENRIYYKEADAELMAVVWGDTQLCNYNPEREISFVAAVDDLQNAVCQIDALLVAGDIVENGFQSEYDSLTDDLVELTRVDHFVMASGNHDIRLRDYAQATQRYFDFTNNLNDKENAIDNIWFEYEVNGYSFLVIGSDEMRFEDAYLSNAQLQWLEERIAAISATGKPVFVMGHYPLKDTHGLPNTWGTSLWESGTIGDQSDVVYEILNKYPNVFYLTGHLHTGIGQYTYEEIGNIHGINVPSIGITNKDGEYNNAGTGVILEVYEDKVISRARDFGTGEYIPEYEVTYELV
ncbi:MAG: metallophosphoesterase [Ruminococcaceae bacterium]|nr:metallophosphoesterase [Oscillospiraceae bacterium]